MPSRETIANTLDEFNALFIEPAAADVSAPALYAVRPTADPALRPLTGQEIEKLKFGGELPAVRYSNLETYGSGNVAGYCDQWPDMPHHGGGEVVIDEGFARGLPVSECSRARRLRFVYIHEITHRICPAGWGHNACFAAVQSALFLRVSEEESEALNRIGRYDLQDSPDNGAALNHAIKFGRDHAKSDVLARDLPALAAKSWDSFFENMSIDSRIQALEEDLLVQKRAASRAEIEVIKLTLEVAEARQNAVEQAQKMALSRAALLARFKAALREERAKHAGLGRQFKIPLFEFPAWPWQKWRAYMVVLGTIYFALMLCRYFAPP